VAISAREARFDALRRRVGLILAPLSFALMLAIPLGDLSPEAHRLAAVVTMTVIFWVTEAIPLAAAALLGPALAVVLGVTSAKAALAPFAHPLIFLFMGGFMLAAGLSAQSFDRRAALWLMARRLVAGSPARATAAIALIAWAFSMWISNTATTAMMIPVALGLHATMTRVVPDDAETRRKLDRYAGGMCLAIAYCASIGGVATPIGTGPNLIAIGMLDQSIGVRLDFFQWMSFALPTSLVTVAVAIVYCGRAFPAPVRRLKGLTAEVEHQLAELGPLQRGERRAVAVFGLAIAGWLAPSVLRLTLGAEHPWTTWASEGLAEGIVAIVCSALLFMIPSGRGDERILTWERAARIDWGTLFLLGGGIALGKMTFDTGLADAIGEAALAAAGPIASHPLGLMAAAMLLVILLTEVTSNTATTSMILPVLIGLAQASRMDPVPMALAVTMVASFAFMLPVSTPPNAIAYGTGLIRLDTMLRKGFRLDAMAFVIVLVAGALLFPLVLP